MLWWLSESGYEIWDIDHKGKIILWIIKENIKKNMKCSSGCPSDHWLWQLCVVTEKHTIGEGNLISKGKMFYPSKSCPKDNGPL